MRRLTVLYDSGCSVCRRARDWLEREPAFVPLELVDARGVEAQARFPTLGARGQELVVIADDGRAWMGADAFIMCLWALRAWRAWSLRLASPLLAPAARAALRALSANRFALGALLDDGARATCDAATCR